MIIDSLSYVSSSDGIPCPWPSLLIIPPPPLENSYPHTAGKVTCNRLHLSYPHLRLKIHTLSSVWNLPYTTINQVQAHPMVGFKSSRPITVKTPASASDYLPGLLYPSFLAILLFCTLTSILRNTLLYNESGISPPYSEPNSFSIVKSNVPEYICRM